MSKKSGLEWKEPPDRQQRGPQHHVYDEIVKAISERPGHYLFVPYSHLLERGFSESKIETMKRNGPSSYFATAMKRHGLRVSCARAEDGFYVKVREDLP